MKAIKKLALLLIALLVILPIVPANAGTVEKETFLLVDGQLNNTDWFDAEDSTYMEEDKLHFPADGFGNTRVISKSIAQEDLAYKNMFTLSAQVQITELPENEKFIFAIGLDSIEAFSGEPGNIEIEITNNGSLQMGVVYYEENGNASVIAEPKAIGVQVGDFFTVTLRADTARNLDIAVNGVTVFAFTEISSLEGRIGFLVTAFPFDLFPHTHTGKSDGQVHGFSCFRNADFTNRSSKEWNVIMHNLPPGFNKSTISSKVFFKTSNSRLHSMRIA